MLQEIKDSFGVDQLISSLAALATFSAVLVTLFTLKMTSEKEKRESQARSKKTLSMMDFILEDNNVIAKDYLEKIKFIKDKPMKHFYLTYLKEVTDIKETYQEWHSKIDENSSFTFTLIYQKIKVKLPNDNSWIETQVEKNYVILAIFQFLKDESFLDALKNHQGELKKNLEKQHLNITSESLEKISNKIHWLKECERILNSFRISELTYIAYCEQQVEYGEQQVAEFEISEALGQSMDDFIEEDYQKISELERALKEVIKPLNLEIWSD